MNAHVSQSKLAKDSGIDIGTISRIETGKQLASDDTKEILASTMGIPSSCFAPIINIWPTSEHFSREFSDEQMVDIIEAHCDQKLRLVAPIRVADQQRQCLEYIYEQYSILKKCCESVKLELRYRQ